MKRSVWQSKARIFVSSKEYYTIKEATISGEGVYTRVRRAQYYEKLTMELQGFTTQGRQPHKRYMAMGTLVANDTKGRPHIL